MINMKKVKTIEALNSLITLNNDRIEDYEAAFDEAKENDFKKAILYSFDFRKKSVRHIQ